MQPKQESYSHDYYTFGSTSGLSQFDEVNTNQMLYLEQMIKKGKFQYLYYNISPRDTYIVWAGVWITNLTVLE